MKQKIITREEIRFATKASTLANQVRVDRRLPVRLTLTRLLQSWESTSGPVQAIRVVLGMSAHVRWLSMTPEGARKLAAALLAHADAAEKESTAKEILK